MKQTKVMERVYEPGRLYRAWQQVRRNAGAAGVDRMTVDAFAERQDELLAVIHEKLKRGHYRFKPARRVQIPKPGTTKKRNLGIPVVMDRIVSLSVSYTFEEIFCAEFTGSNFGFLRGKSQHRAIGHVRDIVKEGHGWCASIDLENFFDEIPHGLILKLIRRKIADERLVTLIARALKAGVIEEGKFEKTTKGCPQGSPLSPMLSNIVLNELDHELDHRGLKYARWADDFLILVRSERAAKRVMAGTIRYVEENLGLRVNKSKSETSRAKEVTFLGFQIVQRKIAMSNRARTRFKHRIRELTPRSNPLSMQEVIERLNPYLKGWVAYYRVQEFKTPFRKLDIWIRNRLRSMQLKKWKKAKKFQRMMIQAGQNPRQARRTWVTMNKWRSVNRKEVRFVLNPEWFRRQGLTFLHDYTYATLELPFGR